jgi:pyruvate/2-oxoacid:ferredoxin oxidoreductase alpha subunit
MANVNRALGSPFNLKADLSDSLSQRDTGWLQFYCESGQEVFDTIIQAYWISEKVLLPVMVNLEGFILSHTFEIVDLPEQREIDCFLPPSMPRDCLDVENPCLFGGTTDFYINFRYKMHEEMERVKAVCQECDAHFQKMFGRSYGLVQPYRCEDADLILVTAGTLAGTCSVAADQYRERGLKVGVLRVRLFRPFPGEEICYALRNTKKVAVIDRDFSPGCGGIFAQEIKAVLQGKDPLPVYEFIGGLGGKDVTDEDIGKVIDQTCQTPQPGGATWLGLLK